MKLVRLGKQEDRKEEVGFQPERVPLDPHLRPMAAVTVVMVQDPRKPNSPPRFIVGCPDLQVGYSILLGGLQTLFLVQSHKAGEAQGATEEKHIIMPPAGLTIPPFPGT